MIATTKTTVPTCRFNTESESGHVCACHSVTESEVQEQIDKGASSIEEIGECTNAGTGCTACHCRLNRMLSGLPAVCGGSFDLCHGCGCINSLCSCGEKAA